MRSIAETLATLPEQERLAALQGFSDGQTDALIWDWKFWARPEQLSPDDDLWNVWLVLAGRGFGKTRSGAEWIRDSVCGSTPLGRGRYRQIALIAETAADAREVMVGDGKEAGAGSGILQVHPKDFRPIYESSKRRLTWPNGAIATLYNATEPDQLRGPEHDAAWCLLGDTPVLMADGTERPIKSVHIGDFVQTRIGAKKVIASGVTARRVRVYSLLTGCGKVIKGTGQHLVWSQGRFVPLASLSKGDVLWPMPSSVVGSNFDCEKKDITKPAFFCIGLFGKRNLGQFLTAITSITVTAIKPTIASKILSYYRIANTALATVSRRLRHIGISPLLDHAHLLPVMARYANEIANSLVPSAAISLEANQSRRENIALNGVAIRRDRKRSNRNPANVHIVRSPTSPLSVTKNIVAQTVAWLRLSRTVLNMTGFARLAGNHSKPSEIPHGSVHTNAMERIAVVERVSELPSKHDVYDITVEGAHEFFANGILVHNCDELAKWKYAQETWDQLQFGLRIGAHPRIIVTTTPRPIKLLKDIMQSSTTAITRGRTSDNAANLSRVFIKSIVDKYSGTRLGRQELEAEILDDVPGALWTRAIIDKARLRADKSLPEMRRIVVSVDPSGTRGGGDRRDDVGISIVGRGDDHKAYVLGDWTCNLSPAGWANRVIQAYTKYRADLVVAEANFGGAMVESTIRTADENAPVKMVTASRGKVVRAEPVAALYEQGKVIHVGAFASLEDEMCNFTSDGYVGESSPNRADALIWALTELMIDSPNEEANGIFKRDWFKMWPNKKPLPDFQNVIISIRTSFDDEKGSQHKGTGPVSLGIYGVFNIAGQFDERERKIMGFPPGQRYAALLCDFWSERIGYSEALERIREAFRLKYGKKPGVRPSAVLIEEGGGDQFSIRKALHDWGVPAYAFGSEHSRTMRAHQSAPLVEQGGFFVPESSVETRKGKPRDWAEPLIRNACRFSGEGSIPEQGIVDQLTAALLYLQNTDTIKADPRRVEYPDPDERKDADEREAETIHRSEKRRSFYGS